MMDNISVHRVADVREAIEAANATPRYLPPYTPDLNPNELSYSAFKAFLRKCAERRKHFAAASDNSCSDCPPRPAPISSLTQGMLQHDRNLLSRSTSVALTPHVKLASVPLLLVNRTPARAACRLLDEQAR